MVTPLKRLEFRQRYPEIRQGLFIVSMEKRLPGGQDELNLGRELSSILCEIPQEDRPGRVAQAIRARSGSSLDELEVRSVKI